MSVAWTLSRNGGSAQTCAAWGIKEPHLARRSFEADEFTFLIEREDVLADSGFAYADTIVVYRDGTRYFEGKVRRITAAGEARQEYHRYTVCNAWWELEQTIYQQRRYYKSSDFSALESQLSPHVVLGQGLLLGNSSCGVLETAYPITNVAQMVDALSASGVSMGISAAIAGTRIPYEDAYGITVAGVIRRMAGWTPGVSSRFDYSTTPPTLQLVMRSTTTPQIIDLTAGDKLTALQLEPRNDLLVNGVVFNYLGTRLGPDGLKYAFPLTDAAGATSGPGVLIQDLNTTLDFSDFSTFYLIGLASAYYAQVAQLHWQGQLQLMEEEISGSIRPGDVLNFSHGPAAWATAKALVQEVEEDLLHGLTELRLGPPTVLGMSDFASLMQVTRRPYSNTVALLATGPTSRQSGAITFTQSGTTITASADFFTGDDVCRTIQLADGSTCVILAVIDARHATCAGSQTISTPTTGEIINNSPADGSSGDGGGAGAGSGSGGRTDGAPAGVPVFSQKTLELCDGTQVNVLTQ